MRGRLEVRHLQVGKTSRTYVATHLLPHMHSTHPPTCSLAPGSFAAFRGAVDALPAATPLALLGTLGLLVAFVIGGRNGALPAEADGLVQGAGVLLAGAGILATFGSLVLQNVAETGNPGKRK